MKTCLVFLTKHKKETDSFEKCPFHITWFFVKVKQIWVEEVEKLTLTRATFLVFLHLTNKKVYFYCLF